MRDTFIRSTANNVETNKLARLEPSLSGRRSGVGRRQLPTPLPRQIRHRRSEQCASELLDMAAKDQIPISRSDGTASSEKYLRRNGASGDEMIGECLARCSPGSRCWTGCVEVGYLWGLFCETVGQVRQCLGFGIIKKGARLARSGSDST